MTSDPSLRSFGIALFENRLILQARAPISAAERESIEALCAGPIPPGLEQLWNASFGGQIDYSLSVEFDGLFHEFSFTELFYPGSDHYHDLFGWIEHEAELAGEMAEVPGRPRPGKLTHLPFGGFEYLERVYVCVEPGPDYGAVFAYAQGLPPAWTLNLHQDSVARIADDVPALFRMLDLPTDPFNQPDEIAVGLELAEAIGAVGAEDADLAEELTTIVRSAVIDWRRALADGTLAVKPRHRRLALEHASAEGDIGLLEELRLSGCDLNEPFRAGGAMLDHALAHGRFEAARWLIDQGCDVHNAVINSTGETPPELIGDLLARGAAPNGLAAIAAARADQMESAGLIADALAECDLDAVRTLVEDLAIWAGRADATAKRIDTGALMSNQSASQYRSEGERMRALRNHCQSLLPEETLSPNKRRWRFPWKR